MLRNIMIAGLVGKIKCTITKPICYTIIVQTLFNTDLTTLCSTLRLNEMSLCGAAELPVRLPVVSAAYSLRRVPLKEGWNE